MSKKVLVLEDEENIRSFLVINLKRAGYDVIQAGCGEDALEEYHKNNDVIVCILDVMLPGIDGYEVCRTLRAEGYEGGIIMLTARVQESDKVTGLMTGADDYVTKPFSVAELTARVDALVRRMLVKEKHGVALLDYPISIKQTAFDFKFFFFKERFVYLRLFGGYGALLNKHGRYRFFGFTHICSTRRERIKLVAI